MTERDYVAAVLEAYVALPDTACRPRRADRALPCWLSSAGVPLEVVLDALLQAHARRHLKAISPPQLLRSLHYFLPLIRELASHDPDLRVMPRDSLQRHLSPDPTSSSPTQIPTSTP